MGKKKKIQKVYVETCPFCQKEHTQTPWLNITCECGAKYQFTKKYWQSPYADLRIKGDTKRRLSELHRNVIFAMSNANMNISEAAKLMYMHRNSIVYNIEMITKRTGKNPINFYDLIQLVELAKTEEEEQANEEN